MNTLPALARNTRVLGIGPTGCGKSYLFRELLKQQRHVVVVDSKHGWSWDDSAPRYSRFAYSTGDLLRALRDVEKVGDGAPIVFRPPRITFADFERGAGIFAKERNRDLNYLWNLALLRGNTLVYHDEISLDVSATTFESTAPLWKELVVTGRFAGCGMWAASQRPSRIPMIASSEASDRFTFFLRAKSDQEKVDHFFGESVPWNILARNPHSFVWANDETMHSAAPLTPMRLGAQEGKTA